MDETKNISSVDETKNISTEINLSEIDWNKLSIHEFHSLEQKLQEKHKLVKIAKKKEKRNCGLVHVKIKGNNYKIKEITYNRLKAMKSEKSKQKLIDEIISSHNPIENI